jgi:hypothetical protein
VFLAAMKARSRRMRDYNKQFWGELLARGEEMEKKCAQSHQATCHSRKCQAGGHRWISTRSGNLPPTPCPACSAR